MEKKLTAQGPKDRKSYMVTLPLEWVKARHLEKTKLVDLELLGNTIVITPPAKKEEQITVEADLFRETLETTLVNLYILGFDELKITYTDPSLIKQIIPTINERLIGIEIIDHNKKYIVVKDITGGSGEEFKTVFRRVFRLLTFISEEILKSINKKEYQRSFEIMEAAKSIYRLSNYCRRLLIKKGHVDYAKVPFYYSLSEELERIGAEYKWFYWDFLATKKSYDSEAILEKINKCLNNAYNLYYSFDIIKFNKGKSEVYDLFRKLRTTKKKYVYFLTSIARRINSLYALTFYIHFNTERNSILLGKR